MSGFHHHNEHHGHLDALVHSALDVGGVLTHDDESEDNADDQRELQEDVPHRSVSRRVRCALYYGSLSGDSCVRILSCGDSFEKFHSAVTKWVETKPLSTGKLEQFTVQYRDPIEAGAEDAPLLRNLCSEDDWDAALQDLYMLSTMEEGRAAVGAVGSMLVRLDVLVRAADDAEPKRSGKAKTTKLSSYVPRKTHPGDPPEEEPPRKRGRPKTEHPGEEVLSQLLPAKEVYKVFSKRLQPEGPESLPKACLLVERMTRRDVAVFLEYKHMLHHVLKLERGDLAGSRGADYLISLQRLACPICGRIFAANDLQFANLWGARRPGADNKHLSSHTKDDSPLHEREAAQRVIQRLHDWKQNECKMTVPGPAVLLEPPRPEARPDFFFPAGIVPNVLPTGEPLPDAGRPGVNSVRHAQYEAEYQQQIRRNPDRTADRNPPRREPKIIWDRKVVLQIEAAHPTLKRFGERYEEMVPQGMFLRLSPNLQQQMVTVDVPQLP